MLVYIQILRLLAAVAVVAFHAWGVAPDGFKVPEGAISAEIHVTFTMPGVFTPTEALLAAMAGASSLKFFPASVLGAAGITAIRAVLPADLMIAAVGGVSDTNFADYTKVGILAFGLGSSLYKPGMTAAEVAVRAKATIEAYDLAIQQGK